jgi:hypothetical protein
VTAIHEQRKGFLIAVGLVVCATVYAAVSAGALEATAFAPVFLGMYLLERKPAK